MLHCTISNYLLHTVSRFIKVRAVFDFDAAQPGDLSFKNRDIIITDGASYSGDGWVTGTCNGQTGLFPSNYTERVD